VHEIVWVGDNLVNVISRIYLQKPEFLSFCVNRMLWEVDACLIFSFIVRILQEKNCVDVNFHALPTCNLAAVSLPRTSGPAAVLRTTVTSKVTVVVSTAAGLYIRIRVYQKMNFS